MSNVNLALVTYTRFYTLFSQFIPIILISIAVFVALAATQVFGTGTSTTSSCGRSRS